MKPRAFSYLRFSTLEQQTGDSFRRQLSMAQDYAARNGLDLDAQLTFHDLGVSGFRGANAEAGRLADFLEAVKVGLVPRGSFLLVEALDRLSRMVPRKAVRVLEDIVTEGITVVTMNDGRVYTDASLNDDPLALLVAIMLFMRGNEESMTKARRLRSAWEGKRNRASTQPLTSAVPAWVRLNKVAGRIEAIPERVAVVQRIFAGALGGLGLNTIAAALNKEGVPCFGSATHWHRSYLLKITTNRAVYGLFTPHRYTIQDGKRIREPLAPIPGYYPPAVSEQTFEDVQQLRSGPSGRLAVQRTPALANVLAGLAICPRCASTMTRVFKGAKGGQPRLVCSRAKVGVGCEYHGVACVDVESALKRHAGILVGMAPSGDERADGELQNLLTRIDEMESAIGRLVASIEKGRASEAIRRRLSELELALVESEREREKLQARLDVAEGPLLRRRLDDLAAALAVDFESPEARGKANACLRKVVSSVVVDYVQGMLRLNWKQGGESEVLYALPSTHIAVKPPTRDQLRAIARARRAAARQAPSASESAKVKQRVAEVEPIQRS